MTPMTRFTREEVLAALCLVLLLLLVALMFFTAPCGALGAAPARDLPARCVRPFTAGGR